MYRLTQIEADEAVRQDVQTALADSPLPFTVTACTAPPDATETAAEPPPDALLLGIPSGTDPAALIACCRAVYPTAPIIVLAADANLAFAQEALRAGAHDVVTRSERALAVLSRILVYAIERAVAESRRRALKQTAANLARLLDALLVAPIDAVVQTDALGTIERLSPPAATLLGLDPTTAIGTGLAEHLAWAERPRLAAMLEADGAANAASFGVTVGSAKRVLELELVVIADHPADAPKLFKVSELAADFASDGDVPETKPTSSRAASEPQKGKTTATPTLVCDTAAAPTVEQQHQAQAMPERLHQRSPHSVARDEAAATSPEESGQRSQALVEGLAQTANWRYGQATGGSETYGFLAADDKSTETLAHLATSIADDADLAVAVDALQLTAWQTIAASTANSLPARLALEVSYGTAANRPHLDQLLGQIGRLPPALVQQLVLVVKGVPKGIYVPTLAKTIRAMGTSHGKPALHLADIEADYRSLVFGHLAMVVIDVADLKRALAKDGKQVAALLERMRREGCPSAVRGATGPLAEALRSRLGIDMTVAL